MKDLKLKDGETYLISAARKGTFMMKVESQCDEWVTGVVVGGETEAMLDYNKRYVGEEVTCRKSFISSATKQLVAA